MTVKFYENNPPSRTQPWRKVGAFQAFLLRHKLVRSEADANNVLIALAALCFIAAFFMYTFGGAKEQKGATPVVAEDSYRAGNPAEINPEIR